MKIGFVFHKDSHFKSVFLTYQRLSHQYQFQTIFFGIDAQYFPVQVDQRMKVVYLSKDSLGRIVDCDYLICCLGGYLLNYIVRQVRMAETKVISLFPGIVSRYQLDAFLSRMSADEVWLNSDFDYKLYSNICKVLKVPNNGRLYGMSWVENFKIDNYGQNHDVIIFEQTEILDNHLKKQQYENILMEIFSSNPTISFKYKTRRNVDDDYFTQLALKLSKLVNVKICHCLSLKDIENSGVYLSISSSALLEGLLLNKRSFALSSKLQDIYAFEFYEKSGLLLKGYDISKGGIPNVKWFKSRVMAPKNHMELLYILKREAFCFKQIDSLWGVFLLILKISWVTKKSFWYLMTKKNLTTVKRSLLYVKRGGECSLKN